MINAAIWPALDYSRVPYRLYHDAEIYEREQERIFRGPVWSFLGLEAEIPEPGDFRASYVGETPIIPPLGAIANAMENATGIRFTELPMSPPKVLKALKEKAASSKA